MLETMRCSIPGRYLIIGFREKNKGRAREGRPPMDLGVVEPPNGGFPMVDVNVRGAAVYKGSPHIDLACHFQAFLASDIYNEQVIRGGDALPPNPALTHSEEFLHPPEDPARGACTSRRSGIFTASSPTRPNTFRWRKASARSSSARYLIAKMLVQRTASSRAAI